MNELTPSIASQTAITIVRPTIAAGGNTSATPPAMMAMTPENRDHQKCTCGRVVKAATTPMIPLATRIQPTRMATARLASTGRNSAPTPSSASTTPSMIRMAAADLGVVVGVPVGKAAPVDMRKLLEPSGRLI